MAAGRKVATTELAAEEGGIDPAFQRAILKIAIELRKPNPRDYDAVVTETVQRMRLDGHAFRRYLGENGARGMGLLLASARVRPHDG
jgi:CRP-like cAMP-binding protein